MLKLGDVLWGQVNTYRADRSVLFCVGGAAVALIIVGAAPASWGWCAVPRVATYTSGDSCDVQPSFDAYHYVLRRLRWRHGSADEKRWPMVLGVP